MRWKRKQAGSKITDVRGSARGFSRGGGKSLLSLLPIVFKFLGFKGTVVAALVVGGLFLVKPELVSNLLNISSPAAQSQTTKPSSPEDKAAVDFIKFVKGSCDRVWHEILPVTYREPSLQIMNDHRGTGPYYMPSNETISIDPQFFIQLQNDLNSPGDFAQAYVIAHETAHHIQKIYNLTTFVHSQHGRPGSNQLSVRLELHADFLAGVWAHHAVRLGDFDMEEGDLEEGINAANNIGDDVLQKKAGAWKIDPSKFTHGTGDQRKAWLLYGFRTGNFDACKLFIFDGKNTRVGQPSLMPPPH